MEPPPAEGHHPPGRTMGGDSSSANSDLARYRAPKKAIQLQWYAEQQQQQRQQQQLKIHNEASSQEFSKNGNGLTKTQQNSLMLSLAAATQFHNPFLPPVIGVSVASSSLPSPTVTASNKSCDTVATAVQTTSSMLLPAFPEAPQNIRDDIEFIEEKPAPPAPLLHVPPVAEEATTAAVLQNLPVAHLLQTLSSVTLNALQRLLLGTTNKTPLGAPVVLQNSSLATDGSSADLPPPPPMSDDAARPARKLFPRPLSTAPAVRGRRAVKNAANSNNNNNNSQRLLAAQATSSTSTAAAGSFPPQRSRIRKASTVLARLPPHISSGTTSSRRMRKTFPMLPPASMAAPFASDMTTSTDDRNRQKVGEDDDKNYDDAGCADDDDDDGDSDDKDAMELSNQGGVLMPTRYMPSSAGISSAFAHSSGGGGGTTEEDVLICHTFWRLSIGRKIRQDVSLGEIRRRLAPPEALNLSQLGSILRLAKVRGGGRALQKRLTHYGLHVQSHSRTLHTQTLFMALLEREALTLARDNALLCQKNFPHEEVAEYIMRQQRRRQQDQRRANSSKSQQLTTISSAEIHIGEYSTAVQPEEQASDTVALPTGANGNVLEGCITILSELRQVLELDMSIPKSSEDSDSSDGTHRGGGDPVLKQQYVMWPRSLQDSLKNFSACTHGFGSATVVSHLLLVEHVLNFMQNCEQIRL